MTEKKDLEVLRSKFFKSYASMPLNLRDEIVAIFEEKPVSWTAAFIEINGKTKKGDKILELMDNLRLLGD